MQLEKVKRAGRDLVSTDDTPSLKAVDILCAAGPHSRCPYSQSQTALRDMDILIHKSEHITNIKPFESFSLLQMV